MIIPKSKNKIGESPNITNQKSDYHSKSTKVDSSNLSFSSRKTTIEGKELIQKKKSIVKESMNINDSSTLNDNNTKKLTIDTDVLPEYSQIDSQSGILIDIDSSGITTPILKPIICHSKWCIEKDKYLKSNTINGIKQEGRIWVQSTDSVNSEKDTKVESKNRTEWYLEYKNGKFYEVTLTYKDNILSSKYEEEFIDFR